jgi:septal ring factor EnvC (AmiA/AmiB activator)
VNLPGAWEFMGAAVALTTALFVAFRYSMTEVLRKSNEDLKARLEETDKYAVRCRDEMKALNTRLTELNQRAATAHNRVEHQAALLYDKQRYIARLEKCCRESNVKLPQRDRLGGELTGEEW